MTDVPKDIMEANAVAFRWKFSDDGEWHYGNKRPGPFRFGGPDIIEPLFSEAALLSERKRRTAQGVMDEPVAWEATGGGLIRYVTDSRYRKFSPHVQSFYQPYSCSSCEAASLQPGGFVVPSDEPAVVLAGWQPIETVPVDERVLVFTPADGAVFEATAYPDGRFYDPVYDEWDGKGASHWMPKPAAPSLSSSAGGGE